MADINIERKSSPPIWLWIVGLLLLGLLIWAIASMMGRDDRQTAVVTDTAMVATPAAETVAPAAAPAALQTFQRDCYLDEGTRTDDMGREHEFTVNCFEQLAASIEGLAQQRDGRANVDPHVRTIRDRAQQIRQSDPASVQHANWTHEAAEAGASAIESMQQAWHTGDGQAQQHVTQVRQAAQEIAPADLHLEQLTDVRSYFRRAGDALNHMAQRQHTG
jgi:hypothetical protein